MSFCNQLPPLNSQETLLNPTDTGVFSGLFSQGNFDRATHTKYVYHGGTLNDPSAFTDSEVSFRKVRSVGNNTKEPPDILKPQVYCPKNTGFAAGIFDREDLGLSDNPWSTSLREQSFYTGDKHSSSPAFNSHFFHDRQSASELEHDEVQIHDDHQNSFNGTVDETNVTKRAGLKSTGNTGRYEPPRLPTKSLYPLQCQLTFAGFSTCRVIAYHKVEVIKSTVSSA